MINAEDETIPAVLAKDPKNENRIVISLAPIWNLAGIAPIPGNQQLGQFVQLTVLPGYENQRVLIVGLSQFYGQVVDLSVAKIGINRKFTANGGGFDCNQRANVVKIATIIPL